MRTKWRKLRERLREQKGAIVIEATISLSVFIFAMFTLLSIAQIAYTQAKVSLAVDSSAKEISQYMHIYYAAQMDKKFTGEGGQSSEVFNGAGDVLTQIGEFLIKVQNLTSLVPGKEAERVNDMIAFGGQLFNEGGQAMSGDSLTDIAKNLAGKGLASAVVNAHLKDWPTDTAEAFLKRNNIEEFKVGDVNFLEEGSKNVFISVKYKIKVIELLKLDFSFHMSHFAYTQAWGGEK